MNQPIKIHGGKHYLAAKIVALFPRRYLTYCEPYFGGGSVLLRLRPEGHNEIVNDLDGELMSFWDALSIPKMYAEMQECLKKVPFSEEVFANAIDGNHFVAAPVGVRRAINFFITARMSLAGRRKDFTAITSKRVRRGMNEQVSAWLTAIDGLAEVHERVRRVLMLNRDAIDLIGQIDNKQTVFYCDPPYLHETRSTTKEYGRFEMTHEGHVVLLNTLSEIEGKFLLSGYDSALYREYAKQNKWKVHKFTVPNSAASGKTKKNMVECVWTNY